MQPVRVYPGLTHRLLVAAARAHYQGETPCDWQDLLRASGSDASSGAVNRALNHLAEDGLIEGVHTPAGWLNVRPTPRGIGRAGGAARRPVVPSAATALDSDDVATSVGVSEQRPGALLHARTAAAHELRSLAGAAGGAGQRISHAVSPRLNAVRTGVAQAWHTFTTLP